MKVTVFGTGYVGLVQAAVLAEIGHQIVCVDIDTLKIDNLRKGIIPIYEPGLEELVSRNLSEKRLVFTTDAEVGVEHGDLIFVAVGTPPDEDGSADLQYVLQVAKTIASLMKRPKIVINKSTVPVGTAEKVSKKITSTLKDRGIEIAYEVVSNPEFLKEGSAVNDCLRPDRIVIGVNSAMAADKMKELYEPLNLNNNQLLSMDVKSAELTKYAANSMLATKISFMNEIANIAERVGADIESVRNGIGSDSRIGYQFINPGCGYGGSCFPKDVQALIRSAHQSGYETRILNAVEAVNYDQKKILFKKINDYYKGELKNKTIALWGLSFKPNTDDMRDAPSRTLMEQLWNAGANVRAYDPEAMNECKRIYGNRDNLLLTSTKEDALTGSDCLVIVTEWEEFKNADLKVLKDYLANPIVIDGRNMFHNKREKFSRLNIGYIGIGSIKNYTHIQ